MLLIQPAIDISENGFKIGKSLANSLSNNWNKIKHDPEIRNIFFNPQTNRTYVENDVIKMPKLAKTLRLISEDPESFYKGALSGLIVAEINNNGGIIK